ncbi:MAG: 6-pyruvoyl-tetrahydropterin synthase [Candidatus Endobugula sp.]|jgi:6-pyruvoyl-tetrahydropterin synthase
MHLFVDNLTNVDFSYLDPNRGLVGETWLANIVLEGSLDEQGMVCDFGIVKKTVRDWLDTYIDHCLVVAAEAETIDIVRNDATIDLTFQYADKQLRCSSPSQAISLINSPSITPESVATWCIEKLRELLPDTIARITLRFTPEQIKHQFYHYSHGLKKHRGNCQRIAHGHRSTIEITRDDQRDHPLEAQWCEQWRDIYVGTRGDLINTIDINGRAYYHFAYDSEQGHFELMLPITDCYLIDTDSTVEFIARHIADTLKQQNPINEFVVRAYEGIGKGAIAVS